MGHAIDEDGQFLRWPGKLMFDTFLGYFLEKELG